MKHSAEKNLGIFLAFAPFLLAGCNEPPKAMAQERAHKPPYLSEQQELSATETLKIVRIPDPLAPDIALLDQRCVIYLNRELGTSNMVCLDGPAAEDNPAPK